MKFETIRTLPRSSLLAKLSNHSCYRGDQDTDDHSGWAPWSYMEMGETNRRTNITATLQQSGLDCKVTKLKLLLSKDTWNSDWNLQTYTQITLKKLSEYEKKNIFWSDEPQCLIHVWGKQSTAYHLHNTIPEKEIVALNSWPLLYPRSISTKLTSLNKPPTKLPP